MSNDNKKRLYDALSSTYDLGTFEDFSKDIEDEGKRRKLYEATQQEYDFGAYEDFSSQLGYAPAPSAREQLQAFYQENGAFLDDFEKRDSLDQQDAARNAMVNEGLSFFKPKSRVSDEERTRYKELAAQRNALEKAWYTSDEYLSQKNATALELGQMRDDIHNSKKAYVESQPQIKMSGLENAVMEGKTMGDYESQQFDIAARIMDKTIKLHNAPSKYDSNSGLKNMGIGAADKATDPALLSAGLTEITDNVGARVVLQKVQKELGNLNDLSEEKIEKILSPAEKAVLRSWAMYAQEQLNRQGDLSLGYQAGQGAVESLAFMAEFALTGGVGKAASEGAETLAKWLGKKWYTGVKGLGDEAAEAVMKAAGEKTLGKYGQKLGLALAETAGRTLVMPSTYRNISEKATEIEEDEDGNRYLIGLNDAFIKGYADSFIETLSEGGRVNALGELVGDIAGKIPAWKKMVDAFSNTKASELLKRLNSTGIMNTLRAGGWHGFGEEYLEEWYGNALRTITGVDKNALKDFATLDNQMVTLASFLPITIFGGTVSTGQVISAKRDLDKKAEALQSALMSRGYDEAQAKNMIDMMRAETPQGISNLITPLIRRVAGANENEARELAKPAMEFAWAVQRYQSYDTKYSYQQQEQRDNLKAEMETKLGKFWMEGEDGQQTVQRGVNEKGEVVYLLGKKDIEETAEGIGAEKEVAAIDAEGNHIFVFPSDYRLEEELPMNDFLGIEIMTQKRGSEAARMASESDAKLAEVKSRSRLGTQLNIGTNEAPVVATISKVDADGVVVETPEGFRKITYTELANKYADINPAVYTDAELDEQEADNISAERAQREAALDQEYENDDDAIEELAEAENEIEQSVEEATKLPLKDDGTVDQAALWNESPARWAKWNDEQKQDGGADTLAYLNTAIKAQTAKIEQLVAAQEAETDFDRRDAIAAELSEARMRQGDLLALHGEYTAQVEAQAIQQQAAQPVQPAPQLTEEEKAALEEERRKPLRAKAKELSEKLGVKVKIAEDLSDVKESKAREQLLKSVVSNGKQKVAGWYNQATGEVTIYLPHAESVEDVEKTFIHEVVAHKGLRGLLGEEGFNVLCDAVWDMMSEGDKIRFINYPGVNGDKRAAADEYMAHFAETLNLEEAKPDMWERIVAIIKQILDSMGVRLRINQEGLSSVIAASYQKLVADAKAAQGVSAEAVTETATETIAEEPQTGGAEVISEERESFRVVNKQEDPNGVTPEQIDEINRSVGGEIEAGEDDAPVRFSVTAIGEGAGLEILKDDGDGNVAFVLPDGRRFNANNLLKPEDIKSLPNTVLGYMIKDAKSLGNVDTAKEWMLWNKYTLMLNAILLKGSAENGGFDTLSSQWQWIGDTIYKTVAINSDSQYSFSLDITRVCKKNEAVINAIAEMQARLGYGITPGQIMDIYLTTSEEGYQVPCPVCYVFSRYIRNGKYATIMINGQRKYGNELVDPGNLTPKQREKKVKFWLDELAKIKAENNEHSKEIAKANSDITTLLDEIDKIAKELTNPQNNFTEDEKAQMMSKIYELDARYKAALNVVSQASLDSWITQFAIHKVKIDGKEQWTLYEDSYMGFPEEMALDLRQTSTVMRKYPAIQRFRNSRGAAAGKEITFVANNDLGDVPLALGSSAATKDLARPRDMSDEEWEEIQGKEYADLKLGVKNLYQQAVEEKDPKKKAALLKKAKTRFTSASIYAKQQSLRGGQRMWSWSDNIERLAPDVFVNLLQLEMLGGALQSYSKQLEGIKLVASMNGYVNGSLMGKGNGYREVISEQTEDVDGQLYLKDGDFVVAEPGKKPFILRTPVYQHTDGKLYVLEFDDVVGIDPFGKEVDGKHMKGLFELNAEYDRAGNIIVGMNDLHIRMCMADDRIFFIIPWHSSGANTHILAQMYEYLGVEYDVTLSQDYTDVQSEKRYKAPTEAEEEADSAAEEEATEEGDEKKKESNKISQFLVDFWNDHYENAREYAGYGAVAGKDFACGIKGGVEPSDRNGNLSASQMHYRELRDAIFVGVKVPNGVDKNGKPKTKTISVEEYSEEWFNEIMNDAFLSQVYTKVRALMGDKGMTSADTKAIYPYEYWDESSTYATADINGARYLEYCRRLGYKPKFCGKLDGKPESDHGNFTDDKGYWKVLIDRRMYAISGRFQDLTPVTADNFTPDLVDPEVTKEEFIVTRVADEAGTQAIVDKAIAREEDRPGGIAKVDYDMTLSDALNVYNNGDVRMRASAPSGVIDLVEEAKKAVAREEAKDNVSFRITPEMKEIKKQAEKDGTFMKAPNGQPTNLTEEQWLMVRTQNFKNWFGDWENDPENASKVVDENGEPKVVFHQTNQKIYVNSETGEIWDELGWKEKMEWDERDDWEDYWEEQDFNTFSRVNARTTNEFDGFFFAPEYDEYHEYGDRTIAAFVNIKNPASREDYNIDSRYNDAGRNERIRLQEAGFDGVIRMDGDNVDEYIAFEPNQIKSATDNNGDFNPENNDIRFRVANENQAIFVSNAAKAVEGIKMEKATPEQWLKMIEKNGGLKAGEDKWMGLSDFLKSSDKKTLTKQEVLDFVNEHMIQIEEQHYDINAEDDAERAHGEITEKLQDRFDHYEDEYYQDHDWEDGETDNAREYAIERLREEMGDAFPYTIELEHGSVYLTFPYDEEDDLVKWAEKTGVKYTSGVSPINETRLNYTTDGLENKHEIALTVPSIESWNEGDDIHFGDAGEGRAVAWIRFGETEIPTPEYAELLKEIERLKLTAQELYEEFGGRSSELTEVEDRLEELKYEARTYENTGSKVLVIDEIQSKRHQEGREKGYARGPKVSLTELRQKAQDFEQEMIDKYHPKDLGIVPFASAMRGVWTEEESNTYSEMMSALGGAAKKNIGIPDAPFEKNWHELAMKRMLRYAAENGYDAIAWTKGEQQAERYGLSNIVESILAEGDWYDSGSTKQEEKTIRNIVITMKSGGNNYYAFNKDGVLINGEYEGKHLSELVGKELAQKLINAKPYERISGDGLKVGGEGMKGFYDKILPAFMNKYGKKWGVKVEDIELPNLEEAGRVMHSVPVTEEMKASVMEGQVMFRISESKGANESIPNYEFESDLRFRLSKNNRELIGKWLNKRGDLTEQAKEETLDLLDQFDDATLQLSMGKWFAQNAIRLPDDVEKCMQAVASAKKAKVDPMKFAAPMEIIDQYGVTKPKDKPINPDKVSTLSKVRELPNGLTIYDVEESEESRKNMREIINTHFGKESSPWCLLQGNDKGELTQKSAEYWKKYNAYPKQVVFKDGKLLAFCANDTEERRWWDRMDKSYAGIPVNEKLPSDRLGRSRVVEYNEETGKQAKVNDIKKFVTKDGMRSEWTWRTPKENDIKEYRKVKADTEEMVEGFDKSSWNIPSFLQKMLPKESVRFVRSAGVEMTFDAWGKILNYWDENTSIVYDGNETAIYTNDERYLYRNGKLVDVIDANNITYTGAETQRFSAKAKEHLTQAKDIQKNAKSIAKQMVADLQGESLRFRVRGENESAMEFTKKEVENFIKRFYDVAPIYVVDKFSSKAELAKAIEMDEQYITDEQYQEILDGYNGNGKAFYSADWSLIITFAKSDNSADIENNLFHESVHKVDLEDIPGGGKLGQWFWDNADSIQDASKIKDAIENAPEYSEEDYAREMLAELLAWYMSIGETEILINQLPSEHQKTVKSILSEIRYDSREEDNLRQQPETTYSRAKDAIRKGIKEYGGKRENAKSNELSAEERRIIGEYFPEFNKSEDVRMRVNSQGKELTEGQREFFANSKAVDKDGNLLALYHGTPRAGFTEFKSGWFTTSKEDAISYSGDRKGRLFDPNEKYEPETLTAGDFRLGYMTFDSEEDRAAFLERFPYADEVMSEREYEDARMGAEDEEYDALTDRRKEFAEVWNAYREYERERFVDTTVGDLIANPEAYTEEDLMRAMLEYDSNATFDSLDDMSAEERKDALVSALQNANEETEGGVLDMVVPTRVPRNGEGLKHNDLGNRTYEVYANVENPYEIDANGRGSEFESGDVYEAVEKALADELYDGVIVRNWRVGRTQQLGDVVVPKNGNQIKLTSNENPTESSDIRFRTSLELDEEFGDAWRNQQNEDGRHSTQVANTKSTYEKIGHYLEDAGMKGASILDASSGLGLGTQALREMGFQVDDVEPFPSENREAPTFSSYADIDGKYDVVISNAVLNVIPDDWRADVLHQMADAVKEGGKIIINTRPASNIAQQGVEGKTRITLDSPSEILVKRGDRIAAYQKGFTSEELAEWIKSELGEGWRVEKATKKNSGISGEGTAVVIKDGDNVSFRTTGTPTDEVVANGVDLTPSQTSEVAANIFAALPEESRKKITDGLNGNVLGLKDAILQIPASLASKENWNDEDRAMADIVAEEMTKMAGEMTRPFSAPEALWLLYNNLNKSTDLVSLAQRSLVQRNLGFDAQTLATENEAKESLRFRQVGDAMINATAGLYNKGAVNVMTRLKESFVDMNASVEELVKAIEERTGKKAEGFENILWALNQQSSRGLAAMEDYERRFLNPMYDAIRNIMDKAYAGYDSVVRHVILKHGLERNKKLAQRDAKAHYQEIYEEMIAKVNSMDDRQKRTHLTNAQLQDADAKAKLATLKAADTSAFTEEEKNAHKRELAKAKEEVKKAKENLERAQKINSMSEQELKDELDMVFEKIENGTDSVYKELRKNDYSGISSMFYDQLGVNRKDYSTEEEYQAALMLAKNDRFSSLEEVEAQAEGEVSSFEGRVDTKELWKRVNAATKETLRQQYEANMISKDQYDSLRDMFEYYVPLRGFKDNTAEDMYTYYRKPNSTGYTKPILGAEGRKTEAESPFGWIASMAGSAIASNVKNEAKLALFYFVSNRQDNGVATISKTWYVHTPGDVDERGKKIFKPVYPPFSEDLSSDAAKAQYEQWQDDMRKLKEQGLAYEAGQRLNLGNAVVNISDANKPEHIVAVKVGGKEYTIVINGNPRAAQAINGELNLEGTADDYSALFGPVLRWMSSVNTSYNPEFWITNMMRDMAFTWMAVNTKEADDKEYRRKFSKNYRKAFKVISLVAKNEKGTLGNSPIEQAYKDFVENGGVTGYTQIKDNETWEKEIDQYLRSNSPESLKSGKMMRGMKTVFHAAHRFGESLEQVSRFAAFLTARETGKSINEAINDAKEITVNFNRKGSGKMISLEEAKHLTDKNGRPLSKPKQWMVVGLSSIAPLGRRFIMFFNAAIQGLNATYKLWKANPKRFKGWVMGYFAVGAMNAILHAMMDDDDDYLDMPQYERRNALMIGGNGVYLKWALPQEARAFYALGDIVVESMLGRNPQKFWQKGGEVGQILTTIGEVLPINPTEGWRAVAPSIAIPALELMINEDYKGEAIYNDSKWLSKEEASRTANWNTAKSGTGWVHVKIAQGLNFLTGGDKYDAGLINIRPEAIEHLVQSAFGGTIRTADKFVNTITSIIDPEEEWTVKQTPFLNRVLTLNDERYRNVHVNEVFDYYAAEAEHAKTLEKKYRKDGDSDALLDLTSSDEYKWMMIYENYKKPLENVRERLKVAEGTRERKQIMREQDELKMMMIKQISDL